MRSDGTSRAVAITFTLASATMLSAFTPPRALGPAAVAVQQADVRASLFAEADRALRAAQEARANLLAPRAFGEGMKQYRRAEDDLKRGRELEGIRRSLQVATEQFGKAVEATRLANVTLSLGVAARDDAVNAEAAKFAARQWGEAEKAFEEAARELENGDVNNAKRGASRAETLYRQAELEAIKANYLSETRALLAQAEKLDAGDRAPKTLKRAEELVALAETQLTESRYDSDEPRALAQEAKREARHAIHLAQQIRELERERRSLEDLVLSTEEPLRQVAASLDLPVSFEAGWEGPTKTILQQVAVLQDSLQALRSELAGREEQIALLEARVGQVEGTVQQLQSQLGGVEEEKMELARRLELEKLELARRLDEQARLRERLAAVERMFPREEARVVREGDDVILRLMGLSFPVARSTIEPKYFPLLTKVQRAIQMFPGASVTIEGHTDAFGGDSTNLKLSQARAEAVREYLLANLGFDSAKIEAAGHGETRPVASNETPEGRARNRRIDVVIHAGSPAASQ